MRPEVGPVLCVYMVSGAYRCNCPSRYIMTVLCPLLQGYRAQVDDRQGLEGSPLTLAAAQMLCAMVSMGACQRLAS